MSGPSVLFRPTYPLHLIHCLCEGLEQKIKSAALFLAIMLEERIAKGGQIVELFSNTKKIFRYVRRVLASIITAGKNDLAIIFKLLLEIRLQHRNAACIVLDGKIDIFSLIP